MVDGSTIAKRYSTHFCLRVMPVLVALTAGWPNISAAESPSAYWGDADLNRVAFYDAQQGWAVGDRGLILRTVDGGKTWQAQQSGVDARLMGLAVLDRGRAWVGGSHVTPYTHEGAGFLLTTNDGGATWTRMPRAAFSFLHDLAMFDDRHAIAVGSPWPLFPSGLFRTNDAGRGWQPVSIRTDDDWIACDFNSHQRPLLVGRHRALAAANPVQLQRGVETAEIASELRCGCWLDSDTAMVAGDNGTLLVLVEDRWLDARGSLPPQTRTMSWRTIAAQGEHVWLAGAPGNVVLHSPDRGRQWQAMPAGNAVPIHNLTFVDKQYGFAVGALGQIRATVDGGRTWQSQRGDDRRLAALVIGTSTDELPWLVSAHISGEHPGRSRVVLLANSDETDEDYRVELPDRLQSAALASGANGADVWREFPNAPPVVRANRHTVEVDWVLHQRSRSIEPTSSARLTERMEAAIRQWRPELLVIQAEEERSALTDLVVEAATTAIANAGQTDGHPLSSAPWRVRHVLKASHRSPVNTANSKAGQLSPGRMSVSLGKPLGELVANAESQIGSSVRSARPIFLSNATGGPIRQDLHSYVASAADTQRDVKNHSSLAGQLSETLGDMANGVSNLRGLSERAQQQEHTRALLERDLTPAEIARSLPLLTELPPDTATRLMIKLAGELESAGDFAAADQLRISLRSQYPDHPAAAASLWKLFRDSVSEEAQLRSRRFAAVSGVTESPNRGRSSADAFPGASDTGTNEPKFVVQTSHSTVSSSESVPPREWYEQADATLRGRPAWQFAIVSTRPLDQSLALLNRLKRSAPSTAWRLSAASEIWLDDRSRKAPKPVWPCGVGARPHLDGKLDDALWTNVEPQSLASLQPLDHPLKTRVWVARDREFLYLAVQCERLNELTYPQLDGETRRRDTLPSSLDRVDFFFDVNRDYSSGWQLGFDSRGWAVDAESNDVQWNPTWHVAADLNEKYWTVESAIPLTELVLDPRAMKPAWLMSVRRVCPGWGWQSWPADAGATPSWPRSGLLLTGD